MNLIEALEILNQSLPENAPPFRAFLACGLTPLHLQTFLAAYLRQRSPQHRVEVSTGLFGDLAGTVERLQGSSYDLLFVVIEWQDIDPRLGIRSLGSWRVADLPGLVKSASLALARLEQSLLRVSATVPTCVCLPTLPLPPLFVTPTCQACKHELQLRQLVDSFGVAVSNESSLRVVSAQCLDEFSPPRGRFDMRSELMAGFPYKVSHASAVAALLALLSQNPTPKKGLITDLDDTLWGGILGEVGTEGVSWHADQHTHIHGLYQQFLDSLASAGILIAAASKNDRALAEQALERKDLIISRDYIYPIEIHWSRKSESAQRILKTWNIGPESVVFIDDSPMEVAEVKAAFPEMECIVFPKNDSLAIWDLLRRLRDLFGRSVVSEEDSLRLKSIRGAVTLRESLELTGGSLDDFLQGADAFIRFAFGKQGADKRAFELINKTNQFNLNGRKLDESGWLRLLNDPDAFIVTATYQDKYGPLGKIAVLTGRLRDKHLEVNTWVMSCRAFSRRIEHQCLKYLFEKFSADEIAFDYEATARNSPLQDFFRELLGVTPTAGFRLSRSGFFERIPPLSQQIEEVICG